TPTPPRLPEGASTGSEEAYRPDPFNEPGTLAAVESEALPVAHPPAQPVSSPPSTSAVAQAPAPPAAELAARIAELEGAIARDEEALKQLISEAHAESSDPILESEELREIARRLPALQADLRALREQRAQQSAP
ncbi:MAG: hypothetical protein V3U03_08305, partial [Myxococcota bacterium]